MLKEASEALRRSSVQEWMSQSTLNFGMYQVTCQTEFPFRFVWAALCITREKKTCLWPCASIPPCSPFLSVTLTMIKFHKVFYSDKLVFLQGMMLTKQGEQGGRQVFETVCGCSFRVWVCFETHLQNCRPLSGKPRCTHPWSQR